MPDNRFLRLPGDVGTPDSSGLPVLCETVAGAGPGTAVRGDPATLLPDAAAAALMRVPPVRRLPLKRKTADRSPPFQSCPGRRPRSVNPRVSRRFSPGVP